VSTPRVHTKIKQLKIQKNSEKLKKNRNKQKYLTGRNKKYLTDGQQFLAENQQEIFKNLGNNSFIFRIMLELQEFSENSGFLRNFQ
jgi:hypothetical protein